jgi:hypothetical protein
MEKVDTLKYSLVTLATLFRGQTEQLTHFPQRLMQRKSWCRHLQCWRRKTEGKPRWWCNRDPFQGWVQRLNRQLKFKPAPWSEKVPKQSKQRPLMHPYAYGHSGMRSKFIVWVFHIAIHKILNGNSGWKTYMPSSISFTPHTLQCFKHELGLCTIYCINGITDAVTVPSEFWVDLGCIW